MTGLAGLGARSRLGEQAATFDVLSHGLPRSAAHPEYRGRHDRGTEKPLSRPSVTRPSWLVRGRRKIGFGKPAVPGLPGPQISSGTDRSGRP